MNTIINIYCDESCHLPNDGQKAMVLGALWCFKAKAGEHNQAIAGLKAKHHLSPFFEIKWTKVSSGKGNFIQRGKQIPKQKDCLTCADASGCHG